MIPVLLATLLISWLVGWLVVTAAWPGPRSTRAAGVMRGTLAAGFGLGLCSAAFLVAIDVSRPSRTTAVVADLALVAIAVTCRMHVRPRRTLASVAAHIPEVGWGWVDRALGLGVLLAALLAVAIAALWTIAYPHGDWDAWAIWNMKARFMVRGGEAWRAGLTRSIGWSHPDYPLLVPGAVARGWTYLKHETWLAPATVAGVFTAATVVLASSAVSVRRGRRLGLLAAVLLLGTPALITRGISQMADVPVGFFLLAALALLATADLQGQIPHQGAVLLAGLALGLGAWTKNEGVFYLVCVTLAHSLVTAFRHGFRATAGEVATLGAGASPLLAVLVYHRVTVPSGWLLGRQTFDALATRVLDPTRYHAIGESVVHAGLNLGGWTVSVLALLALCVLVWGPCIESEDRVSAGRTALVLAFALLGVLGVYVVTPLPLVWQLATSLPRILLQLWPSAVLLFALVVRSPALSDDHPRNAPDLVAVRLSDAG